MNQSLWLLFLLFSVDTFCTASTRIRGSTQRIYDPYLKIPMAFKLECLTANDMTPSEGVVWRRTSGDGLPDTASTNNPLTLSDLQQFRDNPHSFEDRYTCTYGGITSNPVSVYGELDVDMFRRFVSHMQFCRSLPDKMILSKQLRWGSARLLSAHFCLVISERTTQFPGLRMGTRLQMAVRVI